MPIYLMILCLAVSIWAQTQREVFSINRIESSDLEATKTSIESMLDHQNLNSVDKDKLTLLRDKAIAIAQINEECRAVSINQLQNHRCKTFYLKELPEFETQFSIVSGNFYSNQLTVVRNLNDRRKQLDLCVQAMSSWLSPAFSPQRRIYPTIQEVFAEPISRNLMEVQIKLATQKVEINEKWEAARQQWDADCGSVAQKRGSANEWNPYFLDQAAKYFRNTAWRIRNSNKLGFYANKVKYIILFNGTPIDTASVDLSYNEPVIDLKENYSVTVPDGPTDVEIIPIEEKQSDWLSLAGKVEFAISDEFASKLIHSSLEHKSYKEFIRTEKSNTICDSYSRDCKDNFDFYTNLIYQKLQEP